MSNTPNTPVPAEPDGDALTHGSNLMHEASTLLEEVFPKLEGCSVPEAVEVMLTRVQANCRHADELLANAGTAALNRA